MNIKKNIFFTTIILISVTNIGFLFYYAYLLPLHPDEAGYWFNFTNKSFGNRAIPIGCKVANHTLSIYLAKLSLLGFGHTGIGLRFPVILFGILDAVLIFIWIRNVNGSSLLGFLGACFLLLIPWFNHYSHELRGYPLYIFFSLLSFFALRFLLLRGDQIRYWILLMISFLGCYYSNLGAVVFIFNFMATLWILKVCQRLKLNTARMATFEAISSKSLFVFSAVMILIMVCIMFVLDKDLISLNLEIRKRVQWSPFVLMRDVFSSFLGFQYLDDPKSLLYKYPTLLYIFSFFCCGTGLLTAYREKKLEATLFLTLYGATILFMILIGLNLQTRSVCYLLPFVVMFQTSGVVILVKKLIKQISDKNIFINKYYLVLSGIIILFFSIFHSGKYENLDANSGNPYEQARDYLRKKSGPNDLIISAIPETITAFYFGKMIREKNKNIYVNEKLNLIYFISTEEMMTGIYLKKYSAQWETSLGKSEQFFDSFQFKKEGIYENHGIRGKRIYIYKSHLIRKKIIKTSFHQLANMNFYGNKSKCKNTFNKNGVLLSCNKSIFVCLNKKINLPVEVGNDFYQLILTKTFIKKATHSYKFYGFLPSQISHKNNFRVGDLANQTFQINPLTDTQDDTDKFKKNFWAFSPNFQKLQKSNNLILCLAGKTFNNNTLFSGIKVISFKFK